MLVSHLYKFILLRTEKTASTSLVSVLRDVVCEQDKLYPADWTVKRRLLREFGNLKGHSFLGGGGFIPRRMGAWKGIHRHGRAADVKRFLGEEIFADYAVITSERNPWERQVSLFTHRRTKHPSRGIRDFKASMRSGSYNILHHNRLKNWEIYSIDDVPVADHVIRFETLAQDYERVLTQLNIEPERWPLPHRRENAKFEGPDYRDYYDDESRALVGRWYAKEIAHFGYEF